MDKIVEDAFAHAEREYPRESCGLVVEIDGVDQYVPCKNIADDRHFQIDPKDLMKAEDSGKIKVIVHSHPNVSVLPSQSDLIGCEKTQKPWMIVGWPHKDVYRFEPSGYVAPLIGRVFDHGVVDCYTLIRDYYKLKLEIELPDFDREDKWWEKEDQNLYVDNFEKAGFVAVPTASVRQHDVILMQWAIGKPHHASIYLGQDRIMHHVGGQLSRDEFYGELWRRCTRIVVRHKSLCN